MAAERALPDPHRAGSSARPKAKAAPGQIETADGRRAGGNERHHAWRGGRRHTTGECCHQADAGDAHRPGWHGDAGEPTELSRQSGCRAPAHVGSEQCAGGTGEGAHRHRSGDAAGAHGHGSHRRVVGRGRELVHRGGTVVLVACPVMIWPIVWTLAADTCMAVSIGPRSATMTVRMWPKYLASAS